MEIFDSQVSNRLIYILFSVHIDNLITDLKLSRYGANIGNIFAGCFIYADDIVLLSPTCHGLQKLITACEQYGRLWDLKFNSLKTQVATFGSKCPTNPIITLLNAPLQWADKVKYLGVYIVSKTALTDISTHIRQFYSRFNNVLSVIGKGRVVKNCAHSSSYHHIRFWYLWCCGCPGLRGRQHLATPHTRSP